MKVTIGKYNEISIEPETKEEAILLRSLAGHKYKSDRLPFDDNGMVDVEKPIQKLTLTCVGRRSPSCFEVGSRGLYDRVT